MKIILNGNMINIDSNYIAYTNIKHMYYDGHAEGLQVDILLRDTEKEILKMCQELSNTLYELDSVIKTGLL